MAFALDTVFFTEDKDLVAPLDELVNLGVVNALAGGDRLIGMIIADSTNGSDRTGIRNENELDTSSGKDTLDGKVFVTGNGDNNNGIAGSGLTQTGEDSDSVLGTVVIDGQGNGNTGIFGVFITGSGNDTLEGHVSVSDDGSVNTGVTVSYDSLGQDGLDMGPGKDRLTGMVSIGGDGDGNRGLFSEDPRSVIRVGDGKNHILGQVTVLGNGNNTVGVYQNSGIVAGQDNDQVQGLVSVEGNGNANIGIFADFFQSIILAGAGNDHVQGAVAVGGDGDGNFGVLLQEGAAIRLAEDHDVLHGSVIVTGEGQSNTGVFNDGLIATGLGKDVAIGSVTAGSGVNNVGFYNSGAGIDFGEDRDRLIGEVTGNGDGLRNTARLAMGDGPDQLTGRVTGGGFGIYNDDIIDMGADRDRVIAKGGFAGGGELLLGDGNDCVVGFGAQEVNGGLGTDVAKFAFSINQVTALGSLQANAIDITIDSVTMTFIDMERFVFARTTVTLSDLQGMI